MIYIYTVYTELQGKMITHWIFLIHVFFFPAFLEVSPVWRLDRYITLWFIPEVSQDIVTTFPILAKTGGMGWKNTTWRKDQGFFGEHPA
jgi:hypothetical protein